MRATIRTRGAERRTGSRPYRPCVPTRTGTVVGHAVRAVPAVTVTASGYAAAARGACRERCPVPDGNNP
ncbi:hypothetical protein AF335_32650 [Streptomyces eurocidicus]|uniref:Uncharacterized protein n=1 Tax=Streptomyces eurocidicus TaxID=66423 RepID=A0A2N8NM73_STREU|nr:hypothetical protein AF335_32650 [Streptomyces eurocidicus]